MNEPNPAVVTAIIITLIGAAIAYRVFMHMLPRILQRWLHNRTKDTPFKVGQVWESASSSLRIQRIHSPDYVTCEFATKHGFSHISIDLRRRIIDEQMYLNQ